MTLREKILQLFKEHPREVKYKAVIKNIIGSDYTYGDYVLEGFSTPEEAAEAGKKYVRGWGDKRSYYYIEYDLEHLNLDEELSDY